MSALEPAGASRSAITVGSDEQANRVIKDAWHGAAARLLWAK